MTTMEGFNMYGLDILDMCVVPYMVIPSKFKVPDFEKYKGLNFLGTTCKCSAGRWLLMPVTKI